ncbi:hypothetical protein [Jiangella muralis]|uniref:hypothetical protein n=1 Tax=Jiangella muralis TaxID=702383 RepID=UPI00069CF28A|nr:hypothetical protein [Jiangella muralis]
MSNVEPVTSGLSGAAVVRTAGTYRKASATDDLLGEAARLTWLRARGIPAAWVCLPGLGRSERRPGGCLARPRKES